MGSAAAAAIALAVALVLMWLQVTPKIVALLMLAASGAITGGFVGSLLERGAEGAFRLVGSLTSAAVGVAVPAVLAIVAAIIVIHDLWPKHRANHVTAVLAFALPVLAVSVPGAVGSGLAQAIESFSSTSISALTAVFGG